jgi:hypothetical protein
MNHSLPLSEPEAFFPEVSHQGKTIKVGDTVLVHHAGQRQTVIVSGILKKQNHYWVAYNENKHFCPWPLVSLK